MEKRGRKLVRLLVGVTASAVLIGCAGTRWWQAGTAGTETTQKESTGGKVKLRLMSISTDENQTQILEHYIKKNLEQELPDIEVEFEPGGGGEDMANKLKTQNASGELPDVWYSTADSAAAIIHAGNMMDLTDAVSEDKFIEKYAMPEALEYKDGKIYTLSSGADTYFAPRIFYHKKIFKEKGIAIPEDFNTFMEVCRTLRENGIVPMSIMGKGGWAPQLFLVQTMILIEDPQTAIELLENRTDFRDPLVRNALNRIEVMVKEGVFPQNVNELDYGPALELFTSQSAAMFAGFSWEVVNLEKDPDVGMFMWPTANGNYASEDVTQYWGSPLNGYCVNSNSENVEQAVKLAEYCVSQEAAFYAGKGARLNLQTGVDSGIQSKLMKRNIELYDETKIRVPTLMLNCMDSRTAAEFGSAGANLLTGECTAEEFAKEFQYAWEDNTWFRR